MKWSPIVEHRTTSNFSDLVCWSAVLMTVHHWWIENVVLLDHCSWGWRGNHLTSLCQQVWKYMWSFRELSSQHVSSVHTKQLLMAISLSPHKLRCSNTFLFHFVQIKMWSDSQSTEGQNALLMVNMTECRMVALSVRLNGDRYLQTWWCSLKATADRPKLIKTPVALIKLTSFETQKLLSPIRRAEERGSALDRCSQKVTDKLQRMKRVHFQVIPRLTVTVGIHLIPGFFLDGGPFRPDLRFSQCLLEYLEGSKAGRRKQKYSFWILIFWQSLNYSCFQQCNRNVPLCWRHLLLCHLSYCDSAVFFNKFKACSRLLNNKIKDFHTCAHLYTLYIRHLHTT